VLNLGGETMDTKSATGRLILTIFAGFVQFEREMMLERQREGIAKSQAARSASHLDGQELCLRKIVLSLPKFRKVLRRQLLTAVGAFPSETLSQRTIFSKAPDFG
jgi:hypothetical protein